MTSSILRRFSGSSQLSRLAMNCVVLSSTVSTTRSLLARSELPVSVTSTMASASSGSLASVAPQLNSTLAVTPWSASQRLVTPTSSVATILPSRSAGDCTGDCSRHGEHPADLAEALLGVDEVAHRVHVGLVLDDPVVAGEAAVEGAVLDVARHLLGAHHHALDLRVVDGREVGALGHGDEEPRAAEEVDRRVLQAPLRQSELECHVALLPSCRGPAPVRRPLWREGESIAAGDAGARERAQSARPLRDPARLQYACRARRRGAPRGHPGRAGATALPAPKGTPHGCASATRPRLLLLLVVLALAAGLIWGLAGAVAATRARRRPATRSRSRSAGPPTPTT